MTAENENETRYMMKRIGIICEIMKQRKIKKRRRIEVRRTGVIKKERKVKKKEKNVKKSLLKT